MFLVLKKRTILATASLLFVIFGCLYAETRSTPTFDMVPIGTIIIDPGHGGNDPGAIGVSGTCEKDVNLSVATALKELAIEDGFDVIMTREEDVALYDKNESNKKRSDLKNRKKIVENVNSAIFVSIHMNKYEDASVHGAQTFYATNEESKALAECIQKRIQEFDKSNKRVAMKTPKTVYLLQETKRPSVLVEGGFLSNPTEEKKLLDKNYQNSLAVAILNGINDFLDTSERVE